jgi:lipooligosaccharide transport system permease protein
MMCKQPKGALDSCNVRAGMGVSSVVFSRYAGAIVWRHVLVWRSLIWSSLASNVANPILFLFAFGFGLGAFIETMDGVPYLAFIVPGMMAYGAMFAASFETTIGAYSRFSMQRTWDAMLATPVTLVELLWGEVLWAACKAMMSGLCVLAVGALWDGVPSILGALYAIPILFLGSIGFACFGLAATAFARGYDFFSYFFTFWITPMFVFSGVFFDIERFPQAVQAVAWALPMTHLIALIRPLMTGTPIDLLDAAINLTYLCVLSGLAFWAAYRQLRRRMFD